MSWLEAAAAAYEAAGEYYKNSNKDRADQEFRDAVLAKLDAIHATTQATLAIAEELLAWTKDAPRRIKLFDATSGLQVANEHLRVHFPGLKGEGKEKAQAEIQIRKLHDEIISHTFFLKTFGSFIAFPQVAFGVALVLVINKQMRALSRESLVEFLRAILDFYRDCLREIPDVDEHGQRRFGWQAIHAREVREQYLPFLEDARKNSYKDRFVLTSRGGPAIGFPGWEGCSVVGLRGNWNDGFAGISSIDGTVLPPDDALFLVNFQRADGTKTLPETIRLAPIDYRREGGDARSHGDHVAGELNGMIQERNWAAKNEALIIEACATLRILIHEIEQILGPKASAATPEIPYDQREPIILER